MKYSRLLLSATWALILFTIGLGSFAHAAAAKKPATPTAPPDVRKLIQSIDPKANTVTIVDNRNKSTHTYKIDGMTQVKANNQTAKFADIKVGMVVDDLLERDNDDLDSLSLSGYGGSTAVTAKPAAKPKPKPKPTPTQ